VAGNTVGALDSALPVLVVGAMTAIGLVLISAAVATDGNSDCHARLRAAGSAAPQTRREGDAPHAAGRTDPMR
jgi:hypothetical protein